jgi:HupE / UreJ protein
MRAVLAISLLSLSAFGHDIPNDVKVQLFFKPEGNVLRLAVRVPMRAMRDQEFPARPSGYLDLTRLDPVLRDAATVWLLDAFEVDENDQRLPHPRIAELRAALESDQSFTSWDTAVAHLRGLPLDPATNVVWNQTFLDALFEYPIQSEQSKFSIHPAVGRLGLRVVTTLRFLPPGGTERALEFSGDPGLVRLDPSWRQAAGRFVELGFEHILDGTDHLLFLFCLAIPFRKLRALVPIVTAFTLAHSITLIGSAYGLGPSALWFPPLIETLIAASILYMALENIVGAGTVGRRWAIAFAFGLVHGFGFSFALQQTLQFAGTHLATSLLAFNLGVEIGQLLVLVALVPLLEALFRYVVAERMGTIILSAFAAHTAWHWMVDRWETLRQFRFEWLELTPQLIAGSLRMTMLVVAGAGVAWLVSLLMKKWSPKS